MRGNKRGRRRRYRINYKRILLSILILILIAVLAVFGIKNITQNINKGNGGETGKANIKEEVVIPPDTTIKLVATGDIMCHSTNFKAAYNQETKEYDFSPVFVNVAKYITDADIAIRKSRNNLCRRSKRI